MILYGRCLTIEEFFSVISKWKPLLSLILSSCPNLMEVTVCLPPALDFPGDNDDVLVFLHCLDALLQWVKQEILPMLPISAVLFVKATYQVPPNISVIVIID